MKKVTRPDPNGFVKDEATGLVTNTKITDYHEAVRRRRARQKEADQEAMIAGLRRDLDWAIAEIKTLRERIDR